MARITLEDLFVVVYRHLDGHSHDTGLPDEVFTTREEAQTLVDELNTRVVKSARLTSTYFVQTLADRLETIKDECRSESEQ